MSQSRKSISNPTKNSVTDIQANSTSSPTTQHGFLSASIPPPAAHSSASPHAEPGRDSTKDEFDFDFESVDIQRQAQEYAWLEEQQRLSLLKSSAKKDKDNSKGKAKRSGNGRGIKLDLSSSPNYHSASRSLYSTSYGSVSSRYERESAQEEEEEEEDQEQHQVEMMINPSNGQSIPKHLYSPISILPIEILVQSFVRLDPYSLFNNSLVCRSWNEMIKDEATWREGFARAFGLHQEPEQENGSDTIRPIALKGRNSRVSLRRIDNNSWKGEYWRRSDLARRWKKSRTPTVLSDPRISTVEAFAFSREHHFMLSASVTYGVASRSDPFSGKVTKGFLDATGLINGLGIGNPNVEFSPDVTCVSIDSDTSRILWGFRNGLISLTTLNRQGTSPRGNIRSFKFSIPGISNSHSHVGEIKCISTPFGTNQGNGRNGGGCGGSKSSMRNRERLRRKTLALGDKIKTFATAGQDGSVRIWKEGRIEPIWIGWASPANQEEQGLHREASTHPQLRSSESLLRRESSMRIAKPISALEYDALEGIILAGNDVGDMFLWSNIDIIGLMEIPPHVLDPARSSTSETPQDVTAARERFQAIQSDIQFACVPSATDEAKPIKHLVIDSTPVADKEKHIGILSHRDGSKVLLRHVIKADSRDSRIISTTIFGSSSSAEITTIRADFDFEDAISSKAAALGIISNSVPSTPARSPQLTPQRSRKASGKGSTYLNPIIGYTPASTTTNIPSTHQTSSPTTPIVLGPSDDLIERGKGAYHERKFVIAGTKDGRTMIWDWASEGEICRDSTQRKWQARSNEESTKSVVSYSGAVAGQSSASELSSGIGDNLIKGDYQVSPSIILPRHTNSITSLEMTPSFIITGSSDGIIKIYDCLTTQLIRTINDRAAKNAASRLLASGNLSEEDASRFIVRQIVASDETLVASIGHQTLAWRAESIITSRSGRKSAASNSNLTNGSRTPSKINASKRFDAKYEGLVQLKRDLLESEELIEKERETRNQSYEKMLLNRKFGGEEKADDAMNGLDEQEALEYALMISRDEEEAQRLDKAMNDSLASEEEEKDICKGKENPDEDSELKAALEQIELSERREQEQEKKIQEAQEDQFQREAEDHSISLDNLDESEWPSPSTSNASLSPSPSPLSSPLLNGTSTNSSRAMEILSASENQSAFSDRHNRRPDYGRAFGSRGGETNDKVRTVNVSRDSRLSFSSSNSRSRSNATSPRFESTSIHANSDILPLSLDSPDHWPEVSSPSNRRFPNNNRANSSDAHSESLSPSSCQFNSFSRRDSSNRKISNRASPSFSSLSSSMNDPPNLSTSPSPIAPPSNGGPWNRKPSLSGAWTNGSPSFRAASNSSSGASSSSSLLGRTLNQRGKRNDNVEDEMDADLKFAIEMSLAEERSRLERTERS